MAWLNLHTELSARLERRQRGEDRRERLAVIQPHVARASIAVAAAGLVALFVVGGVTAGDQGDILTVPRRAPGDAGPLGNLGVAPNLNDDNSRDPSGTTTTTIDGTPITTVPGSGTSTTIAPTATTPTSQGETATTTSSTTTSSTTTSSTTTSSTTTTTTRGPTTSVAPPTSATPPTSTPGRP